MIVMLPLSQMQFEVINECDRSGSGVCFCCHTYSLDCCTNLLLLCFVIVCCTCVHTHAVKWKIKNGRLIKGDFSVLL